MSDKTESLTDAVARYFRLHPGEWVSFHILASIGGTGGWRTRVSDCRRELGMQIENRQRTIEHAGKDIKVSEYRYSPPLPAIDNISGNQKQLFA